jgi:hypothetical protein
MRRGGWRSLGFQSEPSSIITTEPGGLRNHRVPLHLDAEQSRTKRGRNLSNRHGPSRTAGQLVRTSEQAANRLNLRLLRVDDSLETAVIGYLRDSGCDDDVVLIRIEPLNQHKRGLAWLVDIREARRRQPTCDDDLCLIDSLTRDHGRLDNSGLNTDPTEAPELQVRIRWIEVAHEFTEAGCLDVHAVDPTERAGRAGHDRNGQLADLARSQFHTEFAAVDLHLPVVGEVRLV